MRACVHVCVCVHCGASVSEAVWWASMSPPTGNELGILHAVAASNLLRWSCAHWRVASILSNVPLSEATLRAGNGDLIRVLRSARLRPVALTWSLSPPLARAIDYRPAMMFQPSYSYIMYLLYTHACSTTA